MYGVDMPSKKEFVANGLTEQEVCDQLGADGLVYQAVDDLVEVIGPLALVFSQGQRWSRQGKDGRRGLMRTMTCLAPGTAMQLSR